MGTMCALFLESRGKGLLLAGSGAQMPGGVGKVLFDNIAGCVSIISACVKYGGVLDTFVF
jgi:hypothetical protein